MEITNKTQYVPIDSLTLHPENPRQISEKQFNHLKRSIKDNKDYFEARPIIYNKDRVIFAGNMRWRAAKELGLTEVPAVLLDVSEERENEIMLLDNKENGTWNDDMLASYDDALLEKCGFDKNDLKLNIDKIPLEMETEQDKCPNCGFEL